MGDSKPDPKFSEGRRSSFLTGRVDGILGDAYKSPIENAFNGNLSRITGPQTSAILDATRTSSIFEKIGVNAFQPFKSSAIEALASGAFATQGIASANFRLPDATRGALGIGAIGAANSSALSSILGSSVNASIANTLAESMPSFAGSLGSASSALSQPNFAKIDGILGLGKFNADIFASLGMWATEAGLDEDLLGWSAEVATEDAELESELEAIYGLPTVDADTTPPAPSHAEGDARPITKPLPVVQQQGQNFERSVRVGVALVLYLSIAVISYVATGMYPFWATFIAGALGRVAPDVEKNLTKKIIEDFQERHDPDDFEIDDAD